MNRVPAPAARAPRLYSASSAPLRNPAGLR